jgi:hypothetical protein
MQYGCSPQRKFRNLRATKKKGTELSKQGCYVLRMQRTCRRSFLEVSAETGISGRAFGCWLGIGAGIAFGCDSWDWRTTADDVFASTFKSEKSFEVSSTSLRHSVVSSVARLQNSNPTTTKKITLRRILESGNSQDLYSKWRFYSTAMRKRESVEMHTQQRFAPPICTFREQYEPPAPGKVMPPCRMHYQRKPVYRETVFGYLETKAAFRFSGRPLPSASLTKMIIRRIFPVVPASRVPLPVALPHTPRNSNALARGDPFASSIPCNRTNGRAIVSSTK